MMASGLGLESGLQYGGGMTTFPEFLRPLPKPPLRYASSPAPVNLTHKEDSALNPSAHHDEYTYQLPPRMFPAPTFGGLHGGYYGGLYPAPYTPLMRQHTGAPLSPLEAYTPYTASPPQSPLVVGGGGKPPPPPQLAPPPPLAPPHFKAPPLKQRLLRRKAATSGGPSFNKGSLIQLANGELKRVEDLRTEDFISSAERSTAHRLDPSTVVRIDNPNQSTTVLTLTYGQTRAQVEFESSIEQPYFVYGQGWASCNPEKTLQQYGLKCHRLQVGDVCISLSPRTKNCETRKRRWSAPDQLSEHPPQQRTKDSIPQQ